MNLTLTEQEDLREQIASRAGEERRVQDFAGGYLAEIGVTLHGRVAVATIAVYGQWEDWTLECVGYDSLAADDNQQAQDDVYDYR